MYFAVFTVSQSKGKDSTVTVTPDTRRSWPEDKQVLIFETDQSLESQSDRAWNVLKAIEGYANPKGYQHNKALDEKFEITFEYDAHHHSLQGEFQIRQQIIDNDCYKSAAAEAGQERDKINQEYGVAVRQLKNLITVLEKRNREKLDTVKQDLIQAQIQLIQEIDIPDHVAEHERKRLLEPSHPYIKIERDAYQSYGQDGVLPDSLDWMLELLKS